MSVWTVVDSPIGELRLVAAEDAVTAIEFSPFGSARDVGERRDDDPLLCRVADQLAAYFRGELQRFDLPLAPRGTEFQRRVWDELQLIDWGSTTSYGELARRIGLTPAASRAVGLANGRNPIPVVIPCHRVIGANGKLTGYAGGVDRKQTLLDLETTGLF